MPTRWIPPSSRATAATVTSGESRRAELLREAIDVFGDQGFAGARIDEIARRVGIRRPSAVEDALGLNTLSPDAIQRHRGTLRALVNQLVSASESPPESMPAEIPTPNSIPPVDPSP